MKPEVRRLISPDLYDLENGAPEDIGHFCLLIQAIVGPSDGPGEESFDFLVCTPSWIASVVQAGFLFGRHYLIVERYDYKFINNAISSLCANISGSCWRDVAERLARYGKWEFEDYRESE